MPVFAFSKAFVQLGDPAIRRVLWLVLAAATAVFALLWWGIGYALAHTQLFDIGWIDTVVRLLGGAAALVLTWLLFPAVATGIAGFFLEAVAGAVERRFYPALPPAPGESLGQTILTALRFLAVLIVVNGVILVFMIVPPVFPFVFYAANGYLLGREYYELVALRRLEKPEARRLWREKRWRFILSGVTIAFLLTVPVVNLLTPIIATAA
ncbi:MAG: EI24 domain-containing protein, partial [Rhodospirillales bacterium]